MPKMKTNKGAAKRFKKTASGYKFKQAGLRHILTKRRTKVKRHLRAKCMIAAADIKSVKKTFTSRLIGEIENGKSKTWCTSSCTS